MSTLVTLILAGVLHCLIVWAIIRFIFRGTR